MVVLYIVCVVKEMMEEAAQFFFDEILSDSSDDEDLLIQGSCSEAPEVRKYIPLITKKQNVIVHDRRFRIQGYVENVVNEYSDAEFRENFRMKRGTVDYVLEKIYRDISTDVLDIGRHTIPARVQLLTTLWYLGTPDSYRSICSRFNIGKATGIRTVRRVVNALMRISPEIIKLPVHEYLEEVKNGFHQKGMQNVIGCIDGMHVPIPKPKDHGNSYINRKKFASIILQGICDHKMQFIHCYAGETGANHDSTVLKRSEVWHFMEEQNVKFPNDTHLIGDKAYPCLPELITPYRDNGHLSNSQKNFNYLLSRTRITIERAFGLLQVRFRCLKDYLDVESSQWTPKFIIAMCVLHNICIMQDDILDIVPIIEGEQEILDEAAGPLRPRLLLGAAKRNRLCQELNNP